MLAIKVNVGAIDRIARSVLGIGLMVATAAGVIGVWGWVGIVPLATGLTGVCPAYALFGIQTCAAGDPK